MFFHEPVTALVPTQWLPFWLRLTYTGAALQHRQGEKFTLSASIYENSKLFQSSHHYWYMYLKMSYGFCHANAATTQTFLHLCSEILPVFFGNKGLFYCCRRGAETTLWTYLSMLSNCSTFVQCDAHESQVLRLHFMIMEQDSICLQHVDKLLHTNLKFCHTSSLYSKKVSNSIPPNGDLQVFWFPPAIQKHVR